ncbi:MAG: hypothetical protein LBV12_00385 [Puniceicoccales bacterium]|jgi:hypothetical protein|nr:hypothetical protein [Puniceicoccales bacterium]
MLKNKQNDDCITLAGISGEHSASVIGQKIFSGEYSVGVIGQKKFPGGAMSGVRPSAGNSGEDSAPVRVVAGNPGEGLSRGKEEKYKIKSLKFKVIFHGERTTDDRMGSRTTGWGNFLTAASSDAMMLFSFIYYLPLSVAPALFTF